MWSQVTIDSASMIFGWATEPHSSLFWGKQHSSLIKNYARSVNSARQRFIQRNSGNMETSPALLPVTNWDMLFEGPEVRDAGRDPVEQFFGRFRTGITVNTETTQTISTITTNRSLLRVGNLKHIIGRNTLLQEIYH